MAPGGTIIKRKWLTTYDEKVADLLGTRVAETILASVHVRMQQKAGHMNASDLIKILPKSYLRGEGRLSENRWPDGLSVAGHRRRGHCHITK
jgi:hypothetical protein